MTIVKRDGSELEMGRRSVRGVKVKENNRGCAALGIVLCSAEEWLHCTGRYKSAMYGVCML